ncbi:hypothetical protein [Limosilactobacillus vaginalis]|uniref:hypothetical protein n=1 Tax=Limosilactobacillus vaginalis TaxID=1633 RepID=UPI0022A98116|nr:hypothetical protein [Limosilactobacillus vaginalis]MCZ2466039.1 hypothetical protein [Limosilactobacillus vaginalis]
MKNIRNHELLTYIGAFIVTSLISMIITLYYAESHLLSTIGNAPLDSEKGLKLICKFLFISSTLIILMMLVLVRTFLKGISNGCKHFNNLKLVKFIIILVDTILLTGTASTIITGVGFTMLFEIWNKDNLPSLLLILMPMYVSNLTLKKLFKL